uniref:AIG1-type G domain-containing protein n=1 Tax=Amphiprion percula TaxID=161767 RepID=A0A3P8TU89_AMPPE
MCSTTKTSIQDKGANLRLVLVGQEKVGKSLAANTILGKKEFDSRISSRPLTLSSREVEGVVEGRGVSVLLAAVKLSSPGPHAFLLTLQLRRFTEEEQKGLQTLQTMLSPNISKYTMVPFTYGDRLEDTNVQQLIREYDNLQQLLKNCNGYCHVFNNRQMEDRRQVQRLLDKIDSISEGGHSYYRRTSEILHHRFKTSEKFRKLKKNAKMKQNRKNRTEVLKLSLLFRRRCPTKIKAALKIKAASFSRRWSETKNIFSVGV